MKTPNYSQHAELQNITTITFQDFMILEALSDEAKVVKDYLESFSSLKEVEITDKSNEIHIKVKSDIDSSIAVINKALDSIGYEIDNADNSGEYVEYICTPLK